MQCENVNKTTHAQQTHTHIQMMLVGMEKRNKLISGDRSRVARRVQKNPMHANFAIWSDFRGLKKINKINN